MVIADVADALSLAALCEQTDLVLSCVGPFRGQHVMMDTLKADEEAGPMTECSYYGEPVVKACVEAGCDYVDRMEIQYHEAAQQSNSLIITACGFDSIPADLGVIFTARQFPPSSIPHSVDSFLTIKATKRMRAARPLPKVVYPGQPVTRKSRPYFERRLQSWAIPFPGADAFVVRRSTQSIANMSRAVQQPRDSRGMGSSILQSGVEEELRFKPVQYGAYFTVPSLLYLALFMVFGYLFRFLVTYGWGRNLLLQYPRFFSFGLFSRQGPSQEQIDGTSFFFDCLAKGYSSADLAEKPYSPPNLELATRLSGPEPGYDATSKIVAQAALCMLVNRQKLVAGGVYTPGATFAFMDLQQRLQARGIAFEEISRVQMVQQACDST
eukprot:SM000011S19155  [mRNA]  locus=s11:1122897:1125438:- [translate_table: standard]